MKTSISTTHYHESIVQENYESTVQTDRRITWKLALKEQCGVNGLISKSELDEASDDQDPTGRAFLEKMNILEPFLHWRG